MYDPYGVLVRHRWLYVTCIVIYVLVVISEIVVIVRNFSDHGRFDGSFWFGVVAVLWTGAVLVQAGRRRRSAAPAN